MATLLNIHTSIFSHEGHSSRLATRFVERWRARNPSADVVERDLAREPIPHLSAERFRAFVTPPESRTPQQRAIVELSDLLIDELRASDVLVLGLPMYNFGIPSQLKAYFDHIARAGETFRYTSDGPEGLLANRPVYVFAARGGQYRGTTHDTQSGHVRDFLRLLGLRSVEFVYAEGLAMGDALRDAALEDAETRIEQLAAA